MSSLSKIKKNIEEMELPKSFEGFGELAEIKNLISYSEQLKKDKNNVLNTAYQAETNEMFNYLSKISSFGGIFCLDVDGKKPSKVMFNRIIRSSDDAINVKMWGILSEIFSLKCLENNNPLKNFFDVIKTDEEKNATVLGFNELNISDVMLKYEQEILKLSDDLKTNEKIKYFVRIVSNGTAVVVSSRMPNTAGLNLSKEELTRIKNNPQNAELGILFGLLVRYSGVSNKDLYREARDKNKIKYGIEYKIETGKGGYIQRLMVDKKLIGMIEEVVGYKF